MWSQNRTRENAREKEWERRKGDDGGEVATRDEGFGLRRDDCTRWLLSSSVYHLLRGGRLGRTRWIPGATMRQKRNWFAEVGWLGGFRGWAE